ncbi:MAG: hypothetical protein WDM92_14545 [Caulobacteraceae bacterium]
MSKVREAVGRDLVVLCERGVSFGYNNLVVDMLGIQAMRALGAPVTIDATHAVQLPGADPRSSGASTGGPARGRADHRQGGRGGRRGRRLPRVPPRPGQALCDGPSCLPLEAAGPLLRTLKAIHEVS